MTEVECPCFRERRIAYEEKGRVICSTHECNYGSHLGDIYDINDDGIFRYCNVRGMISKLAAEHPSLSNLPNPTGPDAAKRARNLAADLEKKLAILAAKTNVA